MAGLDFPDNPAVGDLFGSAGVVWRWDGARWASTSGVPAARGAVAYAQTTTTQTGITNAVANLTGLSTSWVADPTRTYRTTIVTEVASTVAGDVPVIDIRSSPSGTVLKRWTDYMANAYSTSVMTAVIETGLSGVQTRYATMNRAIGSGSLSTGGTNPLNPSYILVEDITYEKGSSGSAGVASIPTAMATIPAFNWWISGGAGASAGNPRAIAFANFAATPGSGFTVTDGNTVIVAPADGWYDFAMNLQVVGHWLVWASIRVLRAGVPIYTWAAVDARGTWGNPPGVNGFDLSYNKVLPARGVQPLLAGDKIQPVIWTAGGADATSVAGDNSGYSHIRVMRLQ
jgi:hypothetical protein